MRPRIACARVEADEHVVRPLDLVHAAVPRVQVDAAEVGDPGEAGRVRHHREVRGASAPGKPDVDGLEPVRVRVRNALLVEEVALDAVRIAEHLHRPPRDVRKQELREVDVVVDEVTLGEPALGKEDLVELGELDVVAADSHGAERTARPNHPSWGRRAG